MNIVQKSGKISASSDIYRWGGCFSENGLFVLVEVVGNEENPAPTVGRELLDKILENFTNFTTRNLKVVRDLIDGFKEYKNIKTLTIGLLKKDVIYLGNSGYGKVYIQRKGQIGKILSSGETASGKVENDDVYIFTSSTFEQVVDDEVIAELLNIKDPDLVVERIAPTLSNNKDALGAVALSLSLIFDHDEKENEVFSSESLSYTPNKLVNILSDIFSLKGRMLFLKSLLIFTKGERKYIDRKQEKTRKTLLTIAVILITLLILSVFLNIEFTSKGRKTKKLQETLDLVTHQYSEAVNLIDINPVRSRTLLSNSKISLSPFLGEFSQGSKEYKEISDWLEKISQKEVEAYMIFKLTHVPLFYDLTLIKQGGEGRRIAAYKETKVILDVKNKVVYSLTTDTKKAEILAGSDVVKDAQSIAIHGKDVYILNSDGIMAIDLDVSKKSRVVVKEDEDWGEIADMAAFAGNVYLLDKTNSSIWKYISTERGFSSKRSYLNKGVVVDFSNSVYFVIDGSVWVGSDGEVLKFHNGQGEQYSFQGISDTITGPLNIYTSDAEKYLYILDKSSSRVLVFDKDGQYQSQYQWDDFVNADDFVVSEEEGKIFVLMGSKIYGIDLK